MEGQLDQIGSDKGLDCPHSVRVKRLETEFRSVREDWEHEWASGVMLEAPSNSMTEEFDLCIETG